jgi:hypothetical protein
MLSIALLLASLTGCADPSVRFGKGPGPDARLHADMFTWECRTDDTGGNVVDAWEGVYAYDVWMEYAPDALVDRALPSSGCVKGVDLFPTSAGGGAYDLVTEPTWSNGDAEGSLARTGTGFYRDEVFGNQSGCARTDELLGDGTLLGGGTPFDGARTPAPGSYEDVRVSSLDAQSGIPFGASVDVAWTASGWDESFVQVRREDRSGSLLESVTCPATGGAFAVDDAVWGLFNSALEADVTNLYVGVQRVQQAEMDDGQIIETVSRAMHVAVVPE